jgi:hypothetical protein
MEIDLKALLISSIVSAIAILFLAVFSLNPIINSVGNGLVAQMTWDSLVLFLIGDFLFLSLVFYFLIFIRQSKKNEI